MTPREIAEVVVRIVGWYQGAAFVLTGSLTVIFVALKLTHHVEWSWWWVVSPVGIVGLSIVIVLAIIVLVFGVRR
jgi:hypothetical protein